MEQDLENIIVARFPDPSTAYQALSVLKQSGASGRITVNQAAVIQRTRDGRFTVPEGVDRLEAMGVATGSLLGVMLGVLGGPVGLLLGWGTGALLGGTFDISRKTQSQTALAALSHTLQPGQTALVADVREVAFEVLDGEIKKLGGQLTRRPTNEILMELEVAEEAAQNAANLLEKTFRDQRKAERKERRQDRWEAIKAKFKAPTEATLSP